MCARPAGSSWPAASSPGERAIELVARRAGKACASSAARRTPIVPASSESASRGTCAAGASTACSTSVISPRGGSAKRARPAPTASRARPPRAAWSAHGRRRARRSGSRSASARSVAGSRRGDSNTTTGSPAVSNRSSRRSRAPPPNAAGTRRIRSRRRTGRRRRSPWSPQRPRQHIHLQPGVQHRRHQPRAGIGDERHAGVGQQGHLPRPPRSARPAPATRAASLCSVQRHQAAVEMPWAAQQGLASSAGVLAGGHVRRAERLEHAQR